MKNYLTLILLATALPAFGFNPSSVPRHQKEAPEQLEIKVTEIKESKVKTEYGEKLLMEVQAKVTKVVQSATGIKTGGTIQIYYEIPLGNPGIGGGWPDKIGKGNFKAYLMIEEENGKRYVPAAYTGTFVSN